MSNTLETTISQVLTTFAHNWPYLAVGVAVAVGLERVARAEQVAAFLRRRSGASVPLAVAAAVLTPLCSCGTMAVVLGMMAGSLPWAPILAFMVASPLTSPGELVLSAGLFGWPFALAFFGGSVVLGLVGGWAGHIAERRGWLEGQARLVPRAERHCRAPVARSLPTLPPTSAAPPAGSWSKGLRTAGRLVGLFAAFAFLGALVNSLTPAGALAALFGPGKAWSVPLAALLGLPLYVNTEASLPMVRAFVTGGASPGAALAFLVTGAGTSLGAVAGALTIARWRVVGVVVATLLGGAILLGVAYDLVSLATQGM